MRRVIGGVVLLSSLAVAAAGCGNQTIPTTPTPTPTVPASDSYTGFLSVNGAQSFPFPAASSGLVQATLTSFTPDTGLKVGLAIGVWNGVTCTTSPLTSNDGATQGITITASVASAATLCVRIYDSTGLLTQQNHFEITVVHP